MKYREASGLNHVAEFHELFDAPILPAPAIPSLERCQLRVKLLQEELNELQEAIDQRDLVGIADALGDLQYVLSGAILEFGLGNSFAAVFDEIQRSNMSKTCQTLEEAEATARFFEKEKAISTRIVQKGNVYIVYRSPDDKILKSVRYSEANLKPIIHPTSD
jgi:predicted HAD superfamily Cof-like phosphohydrolase